MAVWLTSDWHFGHQKEFLYVPRGYYSVDIMNKDLVAQYNSLVKPEDDVYCLGDCALGGAAALEDNYQLMKKLNGLIHIIVGNHDSAKKIEMYSKLPNVVEIQNSLYWKYQKYNFYLCHFPCATTNFDLHKPLKERTIALCGHSHTKDKFKDMTIGAYHVEVDCHENRPVNIEEIITDIKTWNTNYQAIL